MFLVSFLNQFFFKQKEIDLAGWLVASGLWLVASGLWLVGWLVGLWLVGWLAGWLTKKKENKKKIKFYLLRETQTINKK